MITGVHALIYNQDAEGLREFFRDKLGSAPWTRAAVVDLRPAAGRAGVHPTDGDATHELYPMCDHIQATRTELEAKGVEFVGPIEDALIWARHGDARLGGGELRIYEPRHTRPRSPGPRADPSPST
ncbi:extradiol dioxygenase [Pseudonocardia sp. MCCB 268]|nr:extradiol dioxygenase [Pseudonocardia cytotoxica]